MNRVKRGGTTSLVILSGGLGNQLFQLMAALNISKNNRLRIYLGLLADEESISTIITEILLSNPEKKIEIVDSEREKLSYLQVKFHNFALRVSSQPLCDKSTKVNAIIKLGLRLVFPGYSHYVVPSEIGRGTFAPPIEDDALIIGYFQSWFWVEGTLPIAVQALNAIELKSRSTSRLTNPNKQDLLVHIRAGDYTAEKKIGALSNSYFEFAIQAAWNSHSFSRICLFSNSIQNMEVYFPKALNEFIVTMEGESSSPLDILLQMRKCGGAVISNSTLSWWAVQTSSMQPSKVHAPPHWFKNLKDPVGLIDPRWKKVEFPGDIFLEPGCE